MNDMTMTQRPPAPFAPTQRLRVELEARQWNDVLALLHEVSAPLRVTAPLVQAIGQQLQREEGGA